MMRPRVEDLKAFPGALEKRIPEHPQDGAGQSPVCRSRHAGLARDFSFVAEVPKVSELVLMHARERRTAGAAPSIMADVHSRGFASSLPLYRKILLAYDGTAESALALREGAELARLSGARAYLYAVLNLAPTLMGVEGMGGGNLISSELERFKAILKEGVRYLRDRGVEAEGHLVQGLPPDEIVRAAQSFGADLVILGYHRRKGFAKWWHTPTSSQILDRLPCSLLVAITQASEATEPAGESTS
jgi:nucleotide-binding universal stress UspA family protein